MPVNRISERIDRWVEAAVAGVAHTVKGCQGLSQIIRDAPLCGGIELLPVIQGVDASQVLEDKDIVGYN